MRIKTTTIPSFIHRHFKFVTSTIYICFVCAFFLTFIAMAWVCEIIQVILVLSNSGYASFNFFWLLLWLVIKSIKEREMAMLCYSSHSIPWCLTIAFPMIVQLFVLVFSLQLSYSDAEVQQRLTRALANITGKFECITAYDI